MSEENKNRNINEIVNEINQLLFLMDDGSKRVNSLRKEVQSRLDEILEKKANLIFNIENSETKQYQCIRSYPLDMPLKEQSTARDVIRDSVRNTIARVLIEEIEHGVPYLISYDEYQTNDLTGLPTSKIGGRIKVKKLRLSYEDYEKILQGKLYK